MALYLNGYEVGQRVDVRPIRYAEQQTEQAGHDHSAGQEVTQIDPLGQWTPMNCSDDEN